MDIESKTTTTVLNTNDTSFIELIKELKLAIENGQVLTNSIQEPSNANIANVNNLSNQTFNYIINWLKQQQCQQQQQQQQQNEVSVLN